MKNITPKTIATARSLLDSRRYNNNTLWMLEAHAFILTTKGTNSRVTEFNDWSIMMELQRIIDKRFNPSYVKKYAMTVDKIKEAALAGKTVHWRNELYVVGRWDDGEFHLCCDSTDSCWGLFKKDGTLANSNEADFYIA